MHRLINKHVDINIYLSWRYWCKLQYGILRTKLKYFVQLFLQYSPELGALYKNRMLQQQISLQILLQLFKDAKIANLEVLTLALSYPSRWSVCHAADEENSKGEPKDDHVFGCQNRAMRAGMSQL